jgi:hydrogenase maturation protein HypF
MRPFLVRLAQKCHVRGEVRNDDSGVVIEAQGTSTNLDSFLRLASAGPPAARVESIETTALPLGEWHNFRIAESDHHVVGHTDPPADRAPCDACLRELFDPSDRRYRDPFLHCTECGPRFTIIDEMPFDRRRTTMRDFTLCPQCEAEYHNPTDRRFHAQVIACPVCGPRWEWSDIAGHVHHGEDALAMVTERLRRGEIIAIKGIGGYHLACDATNASTVMRLRERKTRGDKPFALMAASVEIIQKYAECSPNEEAMLRGPERPIVLLQRRCNPGQCPIAESVAPGTRTLGFLLPYTPLHHLLLNDRPLVMTSANRSGEPLVVEDSEAKTKLSDLCDGILSHNRKIAVRCDDSVLTSVDGGPYFIRRSRGYVPDPLVLSSDGETVLAVGGELKAAPALAVGERVYLGPHVGDLRSWESVQALDDAASHLCRLLHQTPTVVACDAHPDYVSARWAEEFAVKNRIPLVRVFHHEAHVASWQVDTGLFDPTALVVCFDGTGYGRDGTIWGGELFLVESERVRRLAHLKPVPLPGGDRAIEHPARMALAHLWAAGLEWPELLSPTQQNLLRQQLECRVNCPLTSSVGRLFDAVAALIGVRNTITYEGQAAIELETLADPEAAAEYEFAFPDGDAASLLRGVLADLRQGVPAPTIAGKFHTSLTEAVVKFAVWVRDRHGVNLVGLTGGVFQNRLLLTRTLAGLRAAGFEVHLHRQLPCNDGGLAVGQTVLARRQM